MGVYTRGKNMGDGFPNDLFLKIHNISTGGTTLQFILNRMDICISTHRPPQSNENSCLRNVNPAFTHSRRNGGVWWSSR